MTKATQNGTCQYCGREHAVNAKTGVLALHGYQVIWNSFQGDCQGSKCLPLEIQRELTDQYVAALRSEAAKTREAASVITPDMDGLKLFMHDYLGWEKQRELENGLRHNSDEMKRLRLKLYSKEEALAGGASENSWVSRTAVHIKGMYARADQMTGFAQQLEDMANRVHGQPLKERAEATAPVRLKSYFSWPEKREPGKPSPSYQLFEQMKAEGRKPTHRRPNYGHTVVVTYDAKAGE